MDKHKNQLAKKEVRHNLNSTSALVLRLVRGYVYPHRRRLSFAVICMAIVAGTTAVNAYLMKPVFDDVFILRDEQMLILIPIAIL